MGKSTKKQLKQALRRADDRVSKSWLNVRELELEVRRLRVLNRDQATLISAQRKAWVSLSKVTEAPGPSVSASWRERRRVRARRRNPRRK